MEQLTTNRKPSDRWTDVKADGIGPTGRKLAAVLTVGLDAFVMDPTNPEAAVNLCEHMLKRTNAILAEAGV